MLAQQRRHVGQYQPTPGGVDEALLPARRAAAIARLFFARTQHEHQMLPAEVVAEPTGTFEQGLLGLGGAIEQLGQKIALQPQARFDYSRLFGQLDGQHRRGPVGDLVVEVDEIVGLAEQRQVAFDGAAQSQGSQRDRRGLSDHGRRADHDQTFGRIA